MTEVGKLPGSAAAQVPQHRGQQAVPDVTAEASSVCGADLLVDCLARLGVSTLFGVPGDTGVSLYDALYMRAMNIRHVLARDERSAAFMADAYARLTRSVGVVEVSSGGGSTYAVGALGEAYAASVPVLVLASDIPTFSRGTGALTELDQQALFSAVTKWRCYADSVEAIPDLLTEALRQATSGRPAPVAVVVPEDVLQQPVKPWSKDRSIKVTKFATPLQRPVPDTLAVRKVAELLAAAKRPAAVAGSGVHWSDAASSLAALVDRGGIPLATTIHGHGTVADANPWYLGTVGGNGGSERANQYLRTADAVLLIGTRANATDTDGWSAPSRNGPQIAQIDIEPSRAGRNFPDSIALVGDAQATLSALLAAMPEDNVVRRNELLNWIKDHAPEPPAAPDEQLICERLAASDIIQVVQEVIRGLPHIVLADPGTPTPYAASLWRTPKAGRYMISPRGHGPMGYAIPASIGAQLARPDAVVVALTTDGGFAMSCGELETVARLDLPIIYLQFTNDSLGWIKMLQHLYAGKRYFDVDPGPIDAVLVANACGLAATRINSLSSLRTALTSALADKQSVYIDVPTRHLIDDVPPVSSWHAALVGDTRRPSYKKGIISMNLEPVQASTLADVTYHRLREEILLGYLRPNALLVETELAERLEVSRTPVRESLQRLAKDGLIVSRSRRWIVVEQTLADIRNAYDVRIALEGHASRLAAERATDEQIQTIFKALYSRGDAGPSAADFVASNELFHRHIVEAAGNRRLTDATDLSRQFYFNTAVARLYRNDELSISHRQHEALAEAIRRRDGDEAYRITQEHVGHSLAILEERWPG